ncbi:unnamed protein product [Lactuca saligna]|uniref:Uncharacterized protein n=1 Tax=Lactuca saligna TaxID=75948 RepID=A0AA35YRW2_LACSI|nr:unnamed protein product [Lactuca saligna]
MTSARSSVNSANNGSMTRRTELGKWWNIANVKIDAESTGLLAFRGSTKETTSRDILEFTNVSDDAPPNFTHKEAFNPPPTDDFMFRDDNITFGVIPIPIAFSLLQKLSSSKPIYDFGLSSSSEESKGEEDVEANKPSSPKAQDNPVNGSKPSKSHDEDDDVERKF